MNSLDICALGLKGANWLEVRGAHCPRNSWPSDGEGLGGSRKWGFRVREKTPASAEDISPPPKVVFAPVRWVESPVAGKALLWRLQKHDWQVDRRHHAKRRGHCVSCLFG